MLKLRTPRRKCPTASSLTPWTKRQVATGLISTTAPTQTPSPTMQRCRMWPFLQQQQVWRNMACVVSLLLPSMWCQIEVTAAEMKNDQLTSILQVAPDWRASASTCWAATWRKSGGRGKRLWSSSSRWRSWSGRTGWRCWRGSRTWWRRGRERHGRRRRPSGWRRLTTKPSWGGWGRVCHHLPPAAATKRRKHLSPQNELWVFK